MEKVTKIRNKWNNKRWKFSLICVKVLGECFRCAFKFHFTHRLHPQIWEEYLSVLFLMNHVYEWRFCESYLWRTRLRYRNEDELITARWFSRARVNPRELLRADPKDRFSTLFREVSREQKGVARLIAGCCSVESGKRRRLVRRTRRGESKREGREARESERVNVSDDDGDDDDNDNGDGLASRLHRRPPFLQRCFYCRASLPRRGFSSRSRNTRKRKMQSPVTYATTPNCLRRSR